jgi:hypothetical protein
MAVLLFEGWAHPHAIRTARASGAAVRVVVNVIASKLGLPTFSGQ